VTESAAAPTAGRASKCSIAYHEIPLLSLASLNHKRPECARELGLIHDRGEIGRASCRERVFFDV
jgi:hypothetical protein